MNNILNTIINNVGSDDDDTTPIGIDAEEQDLVVEEAAPVYPVAEEDRIGVMTDEGTDPVVTDQGDEQNVGLVDDDDDDVIDNNNDVIINNVQP